MIVLTVHSIQTIISCLKVPSFYNINLHFKQQVSTSKAGLNLSLTEVQEYRHFHIMLWPRVFNVYSELIHKGSGPKHNFLCPVALNIFIQWISQYKQPQAVHNFMSFEGKVSNLFLKWQYTEHITSLLLGILVHQTWASHRVAFTVVLVSLENFSLQSWHHIDPPGGRQ